MTIEQPKSNYQNPYQTIKNTINSVFSMIGNMIVNILDNFFTPLQKRVGVKGMAYIFVLPNMLVFSIFVLFISKFNNLNIGYFKINIGLKN